MNGKNPGKIDQNRPIWGRGSGGVKSTGVSQSVREISRDESQSQCVPSTQKTLQNKGFGAPNF